MHLSLVSNASGDENERKTEKRRRIKSELRDGSLVSFHSYTGIGDERGTERLQSLNERETRKGIL